MASKKILVALIGIVVLLIGFSSAQAEGGSEWVPPIIPDVTNTSVNPTEGNWNDYFNYSVDVRFYEKIEIELWIYHPAEHDWISCGIREYNKSGGHRQTIWWNMTPFSQECRGESSSYKFTWNKTLLKRDGKARFFGPRIHDGPIQPSLPSVEFKNASVEPEIGASETKFFYRVTMNATRKGIACLEIQCPPGGYFKPVGCYDYNRIDDEPVPYKWNVTSEEYCNKEIGKGKYRFYFQDDTGTKIPSMLYEGPEVIIEQFTNFSVNPDRGLNSTFFNFTADLNTTKEGNTTVTLQVRSDKADWINVTNKSYESDRPGKPIPINFNISIDTSGISFLEKENLISEWRKNEAIEWRVKGVLKESSTINTTYDIGLTWLDSSFSPEEGWWNETFNFTVNVSADINGSVELKVKCEDWKSEGNWSYNNTPNPQILKWENVRVCDEERYEGNTSYNFTFHCGDVQYSSPTYDGPKVFIPLNLSLENATVEPEKGGYYNFTGGYFRNTTKPLFDYSIEVTADKETTLKLVLIDPDGDTHEREEKCEYTMTPGQPQECLWKNIELPVIKIGMWQYTFECYDTRYGWKEIKETFEGPEMIAVFENYTVDPDPYVFRDLVNVTVCMRGTKAMNVTLEAFNKWPDQMKWTEIGTEFYEPSGVKCLNWTIDTFEVPFDELRLKVKVEE